MADTDLELLFGKAPAEGVPVELVFGDDASVQIPPVEVHAAGRFTGLRHPLKLRAGVRAHSSGRITGLRRALGAAYNVNVQRPLVARVRTSMQESRQIQAETLLKFEQVAPYIMALRTSWSTAAPVSGAGTVRFEDSLRMQREVRTHFQEAMRLPVPSHSLVFEEALRRQIGIASRFEEALRLPLAPTRLVFEEALRLRAELSTDWQAAAQIETGIRTDFGPSMPVSVWVRGRFQQAWPPRPGVSKSTEPPGPQPCYVPGLPIELLFEDPAGDGASPVNLVFVCGGKTPEEPGATVVVPIRRVYVATNNISLHRLDTGAELHAHEFNMSLDEGSWTWSWSAVLHYDAEGHLGRDSQGDPAELLVVVNAIQFRLRLENVVRDKRFSPTRFNVNGRGRASILADSRTPVMQFGNPDAALTAQQLAASVLTINGVSNGWGVQWGLEDWLVPAGTWAFRGSYIDAINDIAQAAGGYVQPHNTDAILRILPRYPVKPWAWSTVAPAFEIPEDVAEVEGIEYLDKPAYNRVFVGGISTGVFGPFKRTGTAGDVLAPGVNHALITDEVAHRQRGLAEISDTGRQEHVTISMQVLPWTGVILPGQFVRYQADKTYMGIVRSTRINWQRPRVRQQLRIETHA